MPTNKEIRLTMPLSAVVSHKDMDAMLDAARADERQKMKDAQPAENRVVTFVEMLPIVAAGGEARPWGSNAVLKIDKFGSYRWADNGDPLELSERHTRRMWIIEKEPRNEA